MSSTSHRSEVEAAVGELVDRFAALILSADSATKVPRSDWTVLDVAAHIASVIPRYADGPEGRGRWVDSPSDLPAINAEQIDGLHERTIDVLASKMTDDVRRLVSQIEGYGNQQPQFRFHGGGVLKADEALGILIGEFLVHGWDLARCLGRPWPISPAHVELTMQGIEPVLPGWVNPERATNHSATYEIQLRGAGRHLWRFEQGSLEVQPKDTRRIDCHLAGDPATILLVMYRRRTPFQAVTSARVVAWGRRPWLAFSLADRFWAP